MEDVVDVRVHTMGPPSYSMSIRTQRKISGQKLLTLFAKGYAKKHGLAGELGLRGVENLTTVRGWKGDVIVEKKKKKVWFPRRPRGVAYVGGSITEQREGWRPRIHALLGGKEIPAYCGNAGSTLLAFAATTWARDADAVVLEVCINDGDTILEADGDATNVRRALEGLVRAFIEKGKAVLFVDMFLRDDLPKERLTGTRAWIDADDPKRAASVYHDDVPKLHARIAHHYGAAVINLCDTFKAIPSSTRDVLFRDDCHHTPQGAALVANLISDDLNKLWEDKQTTTRELPEPLDPEYWRPTAPERFHDVHSSGSIMERCPMTGIPAKWDWLCPGDDAQCTFDGRAFGIVTHVGPDSGAVFVTVDGKTTRVDLVDKWCYYWRQTIVMLWSGDSGHHVLRLSVDPAQPDRSKLKKPISDPLYLQNTNGLGVTPKLWLLWYCVLT